MKPVTEKDVPKVVQAIRQTTSRKMLHKILTRIRVNAFSVSSRNDVTLTTCLYKITEDHAALRQLMRLRGYSIMTNVLNDHKGDLEITLLVSSLHLRHWWLVLITPYRLCNAWRDGR